MQHASVHCPARYFCASPPFCRRTPYILADSTADVSVGLKLWGAHLPPLEPPRGFVVEFEVVHSENAHWSTGVLAGLVWPACMHRCWGLCTCRVHISPQVCLPVCISGGWLRARMCTAEVAPALPACKAAGLLPFEPACRLCCCSPCPQTGCAPGPRALQAAP